MDHSLVRLSSVNGQFQLNSIRAQEYPSIDFSKPDHQFTLKGEQLKQIVSQTSFSCSDKDPVSYTHLSSGELAIACTRKLSSMTKSSTSSISGDTRL